MTFINKLRIVSALIFGALAVVRATLSLYHSSTLCYSLFETIASVVVFAGFPTLFGFLWDDKNLITTKKKYNNETN